MHLDRDKKRVNNAIFQVLQVDYLPWNTVYPIHDNINHTTNTTTRMSLTSHARQKNQKRLQNCTLYSMSRGIYRGITNTGKMQQTTGYEIVWIATTCKASDRGKENTLSICSPDSQPRTNTTNCSTQSTIIYPCPEQDQHLNPLITTATNQTQKTTPQTPQATPTTTPPHPKAIILLAPLPTLSASINVLFLLTSNIFSLPTACPSLAIALN